MHHTLSIFPTISPSISPSIWFKCYDLGKKKGGDKMIHNGNKRTCKHRTIVVEKDKFMCVTFMILNFVCSQLTS